MADEETLSVSKDVQTAYDNSLVVNLVINVIIGIIFIVLFEIFRYWKRPWYQQRTFSTFQRETIMEPPKRPFGWLWPTLRYQNKELVQTHGLDATMYMRFLQVCIWIVFFQLLFGVIILFPINATGGNNDLDEENPGKTYGSAIVSMANIPRGSARLAAHTISVVFNTLVTCLGLYWVFLKYKNHRIAFKRQRIIPNYTTMVSELPPESRNSRKVKNFFNEIFPGQILDAKVAPDIPALHSLKKKRFGLIIKLEREQAKFAKTGNRPQMREKWYKWNKIDSIDFYESQVTQLENEINTAISNGEDAQQDVVGKVFSKVHSFLDLDISAVKRLRGRKRRETLRDQMPTTSTAFVIFNNLNSAISSSRVPISAKSGTWRASPAPEPEDVAWERLHIPRRSRCLRMFLIGFITFLLVVFWTIPIGFVTGLFNISALSETSAFSWLGDLAESSPIIRGFIEGTLPALIITIFYAILPSILYFLCTLEGHPSESAVQRSVYIKLYVFYLFNLFLVGILASTFMGLVGQLQKLIEQPTYVVDLLATSLPRQANFFINFVLVSTFITFTLFLWRPIPVILLWIKERFLCKSRRDFRELNSPEEPWFVPTMARQILIFSIVTAYSTISPLILPFGLLYFIVAYIAVKYNVLYVYEQRYESGGTIWPRTFNMMIASLIIYQLTLVGFFAIYNFPAGSIVSGIIFLLTVAFAIDTHRKLDNRSKYGVVGDATKEDPHETTLTEEDESWIDYNHPALAELEQPEVQYSNIVSSGERANPSGEHVASKDEESDFDSPGESTQRIYEDSISEEEEEVLSEMTDDTFNTASSQYPAHPDPPFSDRK